MVSTYSKVCSGYNDNTKIGIFRNCIMSKTELLNCTLWRTLRTISCIEESLIVTEHRTLMLESFRVPVESENDHGKVMDR